MPVDVAIGSDHAGFELKNSIICFLQQEKIACTDMGTFSSESVDYPDIIIKVANAISRGEVQTGIIICGSGIGASIVANKVENVRAALCTSEYMAEMARRHNDANIIALGGRITTPEIAIRLIKIFFATPFDGGKHLARLKKIHDLTNR